MTKILDLRKKFSYRFLEAFLGLFSISFLLILIILAIFEPVILAIFLIGYSFFMVLKVGVHGIYTIYTYKNLLRWETVNWQELLNNMDVNPEMALDTLQKLKNKHDTKIGWQEKLESDIKQFSKLQNSKYKNPLDIIQIPLFAVYDEDGKILARSLKQIYESGYPLDKIVVFLSQEARAGAAHHLQLLEVLRQQNWLNLEVIEEGNQDILYNPNHDSFDYLNPVFTNFKISKDKLNIIITYHPDGLSGEIKGKASNEDWAGRQASLFIKAKQWDPEMVVLTSLDADSRVGDNFFQMLSYRFCLTPERHSSGFQPLPVYTNNFFSSNLFPRLVATNTTIWYMIQSSLLDELHFFANYCVPLTVLRKIDFWNREVIAEDSLLFAKCFVGFEGNFHVIPFYGTFEGDAVEGEDYIEAIINQYKQLQRWAWGGIEGFPYKFYKFFLDPEGKKIELRKRIKMIRLEFLNHFFWATLPLVFSIVIFLPNIFGSQEYKESSIQLNLWIFGQYFTWLSFIFLVIASYITYTYIAVRATKNMPVKWYHWVIVSFQWIVSPTIFVFMGPPAIDVQIRGILGKYLGYWVTPKK